LLKQKNKPKINLRDVRQQIDQIDLGLLNLLNQRTSEVLKIGKIKRVGGASYYSPARERRILERLLAENKGPLPDDALTEIMQLIFQVSLSLEKKLKIVYFGPPATFTHLAAIRCFGRRVNLQPARSIGEIFRRVEKKQADYGVVPVENSTEGVVNHTLDMFLDSDLKIYTEVILEIAHYLLGKGKLEKIKRVYSHPQALAQCRTWLEENLPRVELKEVESTARAAQKAFREPNAAAVASEIAASLYHLPIIAQRIEDTSANYTRFLVVGREYAEKSRQDKTSILFSIKDKVGTLYDMLTPFRKYEINLTKIESRPTKKKPWEYVFFVDFIGHMEDEKVKMALTELEKQCLFLKILGSYPQGEK